MKKICMMGLEIKLQDEDDCHRHENQNKKSKTLES